VAQLHPDPSWPDDPSEAINPFTTTVLESGCFTTNKWSDMPTPAMKLSLPKQALIRLIIDHSVLHESVGTWAIGYDPDTGGWAPVWQGRYPHPVEGRVELVAGWKSVALPRIRSHKHAKRQADTALGRHIQGAFAEGALRSWLAAQGHSDDPDIELV